jgi:hypothetical protein
MMPAVRNLALGPGSAAHELAHAAVGRRYGDVRVEWGLVRSETVVEWDDEVPVWGVVATLLAPLLLAGTLALAAPLVLEALAALPWWAQSYLVVQYVLLAGPSGADILEVTSML